MSAWADLVHVLWTAATFLWDKGWEFLVAVAATYLGVRWSFRAENRRRREEERAASAKRRAEEERAFREAMHTIASELGGNASIIARLGDVDFATGLKTTVVRRPAIRTAALEAILSHPQVLPKLHPTLHVMLLEALENLKAIRDRLPGPDTNNARINALRVATIQGWAHIFDKLVEEVILPAVAEAKPAFIGDETSEGATSEEARLERLNIRAVEIQGQIKPEIERRQVAVLREHS